MYQVINIAGIKIKINNSEIGNLIIQDLDGICSIANNDTGIDIELHFKNYGLNYRILSGNNLRYNENGFENRFLSSIDYISCNTFVKNMKIDIYIKRKNIGIRGKIKSFLYGKNIVEKDTVLSYSLFWYIFQIKLMQLNRTFLHAGIFADSNNNAIAITGTGGSGKTSTLFKILEDSNYKYLAEDFAIIDINGYTYYNPKPISVYETDMKFNPNLLGKVFLLFSNTEKIFWKFYVKILKRNPIVKINPEKLLGNRISVKGKLKKVVYVIREDIKDFNYREICVDELSQRSLNVALREFKTLFEILTLLNANRLDDYTQMYTFQEFKNTLNSLYNQSFTHSKNYLLKIPYNKTPEEVVFYLKKNGLFDE